jgi:hypothetical protein
MGYNLRGQTDRVRKLQITYGANWVPRSLQRLLANNDVEREREREREREVGREIERG